MPSILVETGYITNREEEDYLNSKKGQEETAACIIKAVKTYITWLEKQQKESGNNDNTIKQNNAGNISSFLQYIKNREQLNSVK